MMSFFGKHAKITGIFFGFAVALSSNFASAADQPTPCTQSNNRDPAVKTEYRGTVALWVSGGSSPDVRIGWQCFLHNTNQVTSVGFQHLKTASSNSPPFQFESVQLDRKYLPGYTLVTVEFWPNCHYSHCTVDPEALTGEYIVDFEPVGEPRRKHH